MPEFVRLRRLTIALLAATVSIALVACGSSTPPPAPPEAASAAPATSPPTVSTPVAPGQPAPTVSAAPSSTADAAGPCAATSAESPPPTISAAPGTGASPRIGLRPVATGLTSPIDIVSSGDGTNRLFVLEQGGTIRVIDHGSLLETPFLDLSGIITSGGERGLLGLAFDPQYRCNGRFFVNYTDLSGDTVVAEYRVSGGDPDRADQDQVAALLHIKQPFPNHNGGDVVFGPDGMLYVGMGDGGSGGDPQGNGQRLDTLLAKMLRIDVDHPSAGKPYGIPAGNCSGCPAGAFPEIYAYGLRNPWRFSFDRATGDLWIGDVGQNRFEEVDHVTAATASGANFGWNRMEGRHCYPDGDSCDQSGLVLPVAEYDHSQNACSITGGYVYRGTAIPGLVGRYLFADYCNGLIWSVDAAAASTANVPVLLASTSNVSSFGQDEAGELYVADVTGGEVLEIVPGT